MAFIANNGQSRRRTLALLMFVMASLILYSAHIYQTRFIVTVRIDAPNIVKRPKPTYLWWLPLADDTYFRLARLIPCRTVEYVGGPKLDKVDSCANSTTNDFTIENSIHAQQWLYDHQHPSNCTNQRFAIIRKHAWSGFGSTVHQVVWAFGMALAQNRIAVYEAPGNWVSSESRHLTSTWESSRKTSVAAVW